MAGWKTPMDLQTLATVQLLDVTTLELWGQGDPKKRGPQPKQILSELLGREENNNDLKKIAGSKMPLERAKELYSNLQNIKQLSK